MTRRRTIVAETGDVRVFAGAVGMWEGCSRFVLRHLPTPPCRVLEFSVHPGGLGDILAGRGYRVSTIASAIVGGGTLPLWLKEYARQPGGFEAVLINDTARYFDAAELLRAARRALSSGGCLIVLHRASAGAKPGTVAPFPDFASETASRHGFLLVDTADLALPASDAADVRGARPQASRGFAFNRLETHEQRIRNIREV